MEPTIVYVERGDNRRWLSVDAAHQQYLSSDKQRYLDDVFNVKLYSMNRLVSHDTLSEHVSITLVGSSPRQSRRLGFKSGKLILKVDCRGDLDVAAEYLDMELDERFSIHDGCAYGDPNSSWSCYPAKGEVLRILSDGVCECRLDGIKADVGPDSSTELLMQYNEVQYTVTNATWAVRVFSAGDAKDVTIELITKETSFEKILETMESFLEARTEVGNFRDYVLCITL